MKMELTPDDVIAQNLEFAAQASQDYNAYTADKAFWDIQADGAEKNLKDKEYLHALCPVVAW